MSTENNIDLTTIPLTCTWVLYVYSKSAFKKLSNTDSNDSKPYKEVCKLKTVNDLIYIVRLMGTKSDGSDMLNLDKNDYIIMREGIEPIWEDPKNEKGGTFSIKLNHEDGYNLWTEILFNIMANSLTNRTNDMNYINGISVSFIMGNNFYQNVKSTPGSQNFTYIKLWDGYPGRDITQFLSTIRSEIINKINKYSVMYAANGSKKDFGKDKIVNKLYKTKSKPDLNTEDDRFYRGKRYY
jgi:hypothetical protein